MYRSADIVITLYVHTCYNNYAKCIALAIIPGHWESSVVSDHGSGLY